MKWHHLLVFIQASCLFRNASALITINPGTCGFGQRYTTVKTSLFEAFDIAANAASTATATDSRTRGILLSLLGSDLSSVGAVTSQSSTTVQKA